MSWLSCPQCASGNAVHCTGMNKWGGPLLTLTFQGLAPLQVAWSYTSPKANILWLSCSHCLGWHFGHELGAPNDCEERCGVTIWYLLLPASWWKQTSLAKANGVMGLEKLLPVQERCLEILQSPMALSLFESLFPSSKNFLVFPSPPKMLPLSLLGESQHRLQMLLWQSWAPSRGWLCCGRIWMSLLSPEASAWVSGCVLASWKSNSHWTLDNLLCPVEVCFYSSISSGGKK